MAAAFLLLAAAGGARAQTERFREPAAGARLEPGATLEVAWTLERTSEAGFDEMELVLSLDGGKTFPLRVTRDISVATRRVRWRVPALPTEHARLALRSGSEGAAESEVIRIVGPEFAIVARAGARPEELFRVGAEWRTRDALATRLDLPEPSFGDSTEEEIRAAAASPLAAEPPRSLARETSAARSAVPLAAKPPAPNVHLPALVAVALSLPLRQ